MSDWFLKQNNEVLGAFAFDDLIYLAHRGGVSHDDWLSEGKSGDWVAASQVAGLFDIEPRVVTEEEASFPEKDAEGETREDSSKSILQPARRISQPPPLPTKPTESDWTPEKTAAGVLVGILVLLLLLAIFLFWPQSQFPFLRTGGATTSDARGVGGAGESGGEGSGNASSAASGSGNRGDTGNDLAKEATPLGDDQQQGERNSKKENLEAANAVNPSESNQQHPPSSNDLAIFTVPALAQPPSTASGIGSEGTEGAGDETETTIKGVKVKGTLALVCDISGSMSADFPILYAELRRKFPKNTPIILVPGCVFNPANGSQPSKVSGLAYAPFMKDDQYVYSADNTTDAIIYSVEKLRRRTVMFNNDLQDGGSQQALKALQDLSNKRRYTLSGRSLNCDAPEELKKFIERTGGEFKVDPIGRTMSNAVPWGP